MRRFIVMYEPGAYINIDGIPIRNSDIAVRLCKLLHDSTVDVTFPSSIRVVKEINGELIELFPKRNQNDTNRISFE